MNLYLDCYPCFLTQALNAARRTGADDMRQMAIIKRLLPLLENLPAGASPPEIARRVHHIIRSETGNQDPYLASKQHSTRYALDLYPRLKELAAASRDPLGTALRLAIAGNIIDLGVKDHYDDLWKTVKRVLSQPLAIDDERNLRDRLDNVDKLLYLADNAGETVFDRILIETLSVPVIYAVKGQAVLNDATVEDALAAGLQHSATLISNGTDAPGTVLPLCSVEFIEHFETAPLVIAKGQANYETLSTAGKKIFCLLQVKCPVIARDIGAPVGSIVIRRSRQRAVPNPPMGNPAARQETRWETNTCCQKS